MKEVLIGSICGLAGWVIGRRMLARQLKNYMNSDEAKAELKKHFQEGYSEWKKNREKA